MEILLFLIAVTVHECGHVIAAGILDVPLMSFSAVPVGAVMRFDFSGKSYWKEAVVHLSGPFLGGIIGVTAILAFGERACFFAGLSLALSTANLLPIKGFDGGGAVRSLLSYLFMPDTVWKICRILSAVSIILLWTAVLWVELKSGGNLPLMIFVLTVMLMQIR